MKSFLLSFCAVVFLLILSSADLRAEANCNAVVCSCSGITECTKMVSDQKCQAGTANYDTKTKEGGCLAAKSRVSQTMEPAHTISIEEIDTTSDVPVKQRTVEGTRLQNLKNLED